MENSISDIYNLLLETDLIKKGRAISENEAHKVLNYLLENRELTGEEISSRLYGLVAVAEEQGFISGFCYSVGLMSECREEIQNRLNRLNHQMEIHRKHQFIVCVSNGLCGWAVYWRRKQIEESREICWY